MIKQLVNFDICSPGGRIKLIFDALTEDKQSNEWTAKPQTFKVKNYIYHCLIYLMLRFKVASR